MATHENNFKEIKWVCPECGGGVLSEYSTHQFRYDVLAVGKNSIGNFLAVDEGEETGTHNVEYYGCSCGYKVKLFPYSEADLVAWLRHHGMIKEDSVNKVEEI